MNNSIDNILEAEFEWSVKNNKTVRFHVIKSALKQLILDSLPPKKVLQPNIYDNGEAAAHNACRQESIDNIKALFL